MRLVIIILALAISSPVLAKKDNPNKNNPNSSPTAPASTTECDSSHVTDVTGVNLTVSVDYKGCFGVVDSNNSDDLFKDINSESIWNSDGVLTNDSNTSTTSGWVSVGKRETDVTNFDVTSPFVGDLSYTNCFKDGSSDPNCNDFTNADFTLSISEPNNSVVYTDIVLIAKAGSAYALYQMGIDPGVTIPFSLQGTIAMFANNGLSNLSVWLKEGSPNPPTGTPVPTPSVFALFALALLYMGIRRKN